MKLYRARLYTPVADPFRSPQDRSHLYYEDGCILFDEEKIHYAGDWTTRPAEAHDADLRDLGSRFLLSPGFVDTHLHAPQLEMIGSYGGHLLEWLERYTFPTEAMFADTRHAARVARSLFSELTRHGTVTALIFSSIHREATEAFFTESERLGFRSIIGKTMMDRHAPDNLLQSPDTAYEESLALLKTWNDRGLQRYAITPRFAPTSTSALLDAAGSLRKEFPDAYVQTHVSESLNEVAWVRELFPDRKSYCDVYDHHGLLGPKTILAHAVHLTAEERELLSERDARISHCPNSNLFLGSGLFPLNEIVHSGIVFGLGSDIGAGTTPSQFTAMADAYKVQQVRGMSLSPFQLWYLSTLGGAATLSLDGETGSLEPGKSADFVVLDLEATPLLVLRTSHASSVEDLLAGLIFIGDDRVVAETTIAGRTVHTRP